MRASGRAVAAASGVANQRRRSKDFTRNTMQLPSPTVSLPVRGALGARRRSPRLPSATFAKRHREDEN